MSFCSLVDIEFQEKNPRELHFFLLLSWRGNYPIPPITKKISIPVSTKLPASRINRLTVGQSLRWVDYSVYICSKSVLCA